MKEEGLKSVLGAAVVGGFLTVLGELLLMLFGSLGVGASNPVLLLAVVLATMCLVGGILFLTDVYSKLEKFGGAGALLPFTGFAVGVAGVTYGARIAGAKASGAMKASWKMFFQLLWWPLLVAVAIGVVSAFVMQ